MDRNNIAPEDRPAVLQQMMPMLDYQSKMQLAQAQEQDRLSRERETTEYHRASLDQRAGTSEAGGWTMVTGQDGKNWRLNTRTGEAVPVQLGGQDASGVTKTGAKFTPGAGASDVTDYGQPLKNTTQEAMAQAIAEGRAAPIPSGSRVKGGPETMARFPDQPRLRRERLRDKGRGRKILVNSKGGGLVNTINTAYSHVGNLLATSAELKNVACQLGTTSRTVGGRGWRDCTETVGAQKAIVAGEVVKRSWAQAAARLKTARRFSAVRRGQHPPAMPA